MMTMRAAAVIRILLLVVSLCSAIEAQSSKETAVAAPCVFCLSGDPITLPDKPIDLPGLEFLGTCGRAQFILATLPEDECHLITAPLRSYCGCTPMENACTLCTDGSQISDEFRSKEIPYLAPAFGGVAPTCEFLDGFLGRNYISGEEACGAVQLINFACGCPPLENHCVYCPGEDGLLREEYADTVLPFVSNEALGITGTCEIYWYTQYQYDKDDIKCLQSDFVTFHCGCNDGLMGYFGTTNSRQEVVMACIPRVVGLVSFIASILVQLHILRDRKKWSSVYHQLVLLVTTFDMVSALVYIVGAAAVNEMDANTGLTNGIYGAHGNDASCKTSGFFFHLGFTSMYLNVSLIVYFVLVIVYGVRETKLRSLRRYLFALPLLLGFALSFASIPFITVAWTHCQADTNSWSGSRWSLFLFQIMPVGGSTTVIISLLVFLYAKVRAQLRKTRDKNLRNFSINANADGPSSSLGFSTTPAAATTTTTKRRRRTSNISSQKKDSLEQEVFWVCISYTTAFAVTWPIWLVAQCQGANVTLPLWFWVIVVTVSPAQGLGNAYCYFRPSLRKQKKKGNAIETRFCQGFFQQVAFLCFVNRRDPDLNDLDPTDELANLRHQSSATGTGYICNDDEIDAYGSSDDEFVPYDAVIPENDDEVALDSAVVLENYDQPIALDGN